MLRSSRHKFHDHHHVWSRYHPTVVISYMGVWHEYGLGMQMRGMAGHNKWSKIKRKKGLKDVNRGLQISKATRAIRSASRACNGDMSNLHLQSTIAAAKAIQVPKDRITDAIAVASSSHKNNEYETIRYDGRVTCAGNKVAMMVLALTENRNRTAANVRAIFSKAGGELLSTGAHDWSFDHIGIVSIPQSNWSEDEVDDLLECALEKARAIDVEFIDNEDPGMAIVKCLPSDLHPCVTALRENGYETKEFESTYFPKEPLSSLTTEDSKVALEKILDQLDQDEDVTYVYHNAQIASDDDNDS